VGAEKHVTFEIQAIKNGNWLRLLRRLCHCGIRDQFSAHRGAQAALIAVLALTLWVGEAQGSVIITSPELRVAPSAHKPFAIRIESDEPPSSQVKLLVRGLPPGAHLSEGGMFGPGVWVVPLNAIPTLTVRAPAKTSRNDLRLTLVTLDGKLLAETKVALVIAPDSAADDRKPVAAPPVKHMTDGEREAATQLLRRGDQSLRDGNVAAAQEFYRRAANYGSAEAAMALGSTYDPIEIARMKAVGLRPNPALAKEWYERARELGARESDARLGRLQ
jgi:hypothetical protein